MKYATWKLNFTDPNYGTGCEPSIVEQGFSAEGGFPTGDITQGSDIVGYFTGEPTDLEAWNFTEIDQEGALNLAKSVNETAFVSAEGKIVFPLVEVE